MAGEGGGGQAARQTISCLVIGPLGSIAIVRLRFDAALSWRGMSPCLSLRFSYRTRRAAPARRGGQVPEGADVAISIVSPGSPKTESSDLEHFAPEEVVCIGRGKGGGGGACK